MMLEFYGTLMKRIYFLKTLIYTDFNYSKAASFVKVLNFDKVIKKTKRKIRFNLRLRKSESVLSAF
jgi:hypothetical protein